MSHPPHQPYRTPQHGRPQGEQWQHGQPQYPPPPYGHASTGATDYSYPGPTALAPQVPVRRRHAWPWAIGTVALRLPALLLGALLVLVGCAQPIEGRASSTTASTAPTWTPPPAPRTTQPEVPAVVSLPAPAGPARELSARDWAQIAKSPDSHVGEHVVVWGYVTQFDTVTGPSAFRANLDGVRHSHTYEYDTNAILVGRSADQLADVVQDDVFRAEVTITGSYSYQTTMGGVLTVPQMQVEKIEITR